MRDSIVRTVKRAVSLTIVLWLGVATPAAATENDPGAWLVVTATDTMGADGSRWRYWVDAQARYFDLGSGASQYLLRPAIGYELNGGAIAWLGYARFRSRTRSGEYFDEDRFWQQLGWNAGRLGAGKLTLRIRLEQRSVSRGDDVGVTLRLMGKYVQPLSGSGRTELVLAAEPFLSLLDTDWGGRSRLSQNRVFLGFARPFGKSLRVEAGYMNQFFWADDVEDRSNHLAIVNLRMSFR